MFKTAIVEDNSVDAGKLKDFLERTVIGIWKLGFCLGSHVDRKCNGLAFLSLEQASL